MSKLRQIDGPASVQKVKNFIFLITFQIPRYNRCAVPLMGLIRDRTSTANSLQIVPEDTPVQDAFLVADDILRQGVVGISEIIIKPGMVNVDFADVRY